VEAAASSWQRPRAALKRRGQDIIRQVGQTASLVRPTVSALDTSTSWSPLHDAKLVTELKMQAVDERVGVKLPVQAALQSDSVQRSQMRCRVCPIVRIHAVHTKTAEELCQALVGWYIMFHAMLLEVKYWYPVLRN
jgi:hypothetical protein